MLDNENAVICAATRAIGSGAKAFACEEAWVFLAGRTRNKFDKFDKVAKDFTTAG